MAYDIFPAVDENYSFPPEVRNALATSAELRGVIVALTTTQRNALAGANLWDGRVIINTTTDRLNRYDAGTTAWVEIPDQSDVSAVLNRTILALTTTQRDALTGVNLWDGRVIANLTTDRLNRYDAGTASWTVVADQADVNAAAAANLAEMQGPYIRRSSLTAQSIANASVTQVTFSTTDFSRGAWNPTSAGAITVPKTGFYMVGAMFAFNTNAAGRRLVDILADGVMIVRQEVSPAPAGLYPTTTAVGCALLDAGDVLTASIYQTAGGAVTLAPNSTPSQLWARYMP